MVNPNIAPKIELDIDGRIAEIEKFLEDQEKKVEIPTQPTQQVSTVDEDVLTLLKKISENQEIERKRYERNNPVTGDEPIYDWAEATINPGQAVDFIYIIPEGRSFYFEYLNVVHNIDTDYSIWIDGAFQPTLSYALQDFGDHMQIYKPPKMAYNTIRIRCLNMWVAPQTYATFFRGFNRFYRSINREITYESLKKEEQET